MDEQIRVFLINDERMIGEALLAAIGACADMSIVGADDGPADPLDSADGSPPDVAVVSVTGLHPAGADRVRQALDRWPSAKVVVLSPFLNKVFVTNVLRVGVHAYVTTGSATSELLEAIRAVASGATYFCRQVRQSILDGFARSRSDSLMPQQTDLTDREVTLLRLFGDGRSSKEVAISMNLSSKTIDACRRQLMQKLDVNNAAGLIKYAIALGLTTPDPLPLCSR